MILQPPETASLSRGNTARFVCNSSGEPPPVLHWLKNGQPIKSFRRVKTQSPGVLLINQLALEDAGYYQCIADNGLGTACATAKLTVIVREGLPSPPRHLSATPYSSTTALLTWEKPEYNSDQIIGYSVHCQRAAGVSPSRIVCMSSFPYKEKNDLHINILFRPRQCGVPVCDEQRHHRVSRQRASPSYCLHFLCGGILSHGCQSPVPACYCRDAGRRWVIKLIHR